MPLRKKDGKIKESLKPKITQEVTGQDLETRVMKDVMLVKVKRLKILSKDL